MDPDEIAEERAVLFAEVREFAPQHEWSVQQLADYMLTWEEGFWERNPDAEPRGAIEQDCA